MINNELNPERWRSRLLESGRVQIWDFLQPAAAERIAHCLEAEVPWTLAFDQGEGTRALAHADYTTLSAGDRATLYMRIAQASPEKFSYAYDSYDMLEAYQAGLHPDLLLHRVLEFFNSEPYLQFMRQLTGDGRIKRVSAQASRYRPGQYLRRHNDKHSGEGRLFAYVLNLAREWDADWGGLLQFTGDDGTVTETFIPRWNSLSLFAVPADHAVSLVAPWAGRDRLAVTGWFRL